MTETVTVECANCGKRESYQSDEELAEKECSRCNYKYKNSGVNKYYPDRA
jgi:DNA-directed RNA polymerase subunit RPC12/RpoP